jgi:uracil-DNA glycosylase
MTTAQHPVDQLFDHLVEAIPDCKYPEVIRPIRKRIPGEAFFPGGPGLRIEASSQRPAFPIRGVMVVGQDFDSEVAYEKSLERERRDPKSPTWENLIPFLERVGIAPKTCFFTNFFMGLRKGTKATGKFPGARDKNFVARCGEFMKEQLRVQRPQLVLTLGIQVPSRLGTLAPKKLGEWVGVSSFRDLDKTKTGPVAHGVEFEGEGLGFSCTVVALVHPSYRSHPTYPKSYAAQRAEEEMVRKAFQDSGMAAWKPAEV